jgi:putative MFS transporter
MGAIAVWFIRRAVPESPRWLAQQGRPAEADRIVKAIEARVQAQHGRPLPEPTAPRPQVKAPTSTFRELWQPPYRSRMVMLLAFNFFQAIGYYGFANWVPALLIGQGIEVTKSLLYSFIIAFALPNGPLLAMTVADKMQRKWLIVVPALFVIVFGILFGQLRDPLLLTLCGVLISLAGQVISASYHAYQSELFPTNVRCRANGFVYSASRVGAMLSGFLIAFLLRHFGVAGVFLGITGCMLIVVIAIGMFGPGTNCLTLEELSH